MSSRYEPSVAESSIVPLHSTCNVPLHRHYIVHATSPLHRPAYTVRTHQGSDLPEFAQASLADERVAHVVDGKPSQCGGRDPHGARSLLVPVGTCARASGGASLASWLSYLASAPRNLRHGGRASLRGKRAHLRQRGALPRLSALSPLRRSASASAGAALRQSGHQF